MKNLVKGEELAREKIREEHGESIALRNAGNLQRASKQNLEDIFRSLGSEMEQRLQEALEITRGTIEAIFRQRIEKAGIAGPQLGRIQTLEKEFDCLQKELTTIVNGWNTSA